MVYITCSHVQWKIYLNSVHDKYTQYNVLGYGFKKKKRRFYHSNRDPIIFYIMYEKIEDVVHKAMIGYVCGWLDLIWYKLEDLCIFCVSFVIGCDV